jgi:hypothetical protein
VSKTLGYVRAEEERRGLIRWLRPEFQNPTGKKQTAIAVADEPVAEKKTAKATKQSWPKSLSEQAGIMLPYGLRKPREPRSRGRRRLLRFVRYAHYAEQPESLISFIHRC